MASTSTDVRLQETLPDARMNEHEAPMTVKETSLRAWLVVVASSSIFAVYLGLTYTFGIIQLALADSRLSSVPILSFIGSLGAAICPFTGIFVARIMRRFGYRRTALAGSFLVGLGQFCASWSTDSLAAMFGTQGVIFGIGAALCFLPASTVPQLWFKKKRGLATGIVYAGAGIGAALLSILTEKLITAFGLAIALRVLGGVAWAVGIPAAFILKTPQTPQNPVRSFQWQLFSNKRFLVLLCVGSIATFPLFVPPFLLPLFCNAIGLSKSLGAVVLAIWNLSSAAGRVLMGIGSDTIIGPINSMLLTLLVTGLSMLTLWPFSLNLGTVIVFAVLNGAGSGGFFSLFPVITGHVFGSEVVANALSTLVTFWTLGYFMGSPIAGYILNAAGGKVDGIDAFRAPMFYGGSLALISAFFVVVLRFQVDRRIFVKA